MKTNNNIMKTTYIFMGLFALLAVYLIGYILTQGKKDINNTYNKRQSLLAEKIVRGTIYSKDDQEHFLQRRSSYAFQTLSSQPPRLLT